MRDIVVKRAMTRDPPRIGAGETVRGAAERMSKRNTSFLLVCGAADELLGVITDHDITERVIAAGRDPAGTLVRDTLTPDPICCREDDDLEDAAWLMERRSVRRVVVLDRAHRVVGVLSVDDVARALADGLVGDVLRHTRAPL